MKFVINLFFLFFCLNVFAQKPVIDTSVFGKWPAVSGGKICNNGKYVSYTIDNQPVYSKTCIIQATESTWKKELPDVQSVTFTEDSRKAIYSRGNETLCIVTLGSGKTEYIHTANSFQLFKSKNEEWIAYLLNNKESELILRNMATGAEKRFSGVESYILSKTANTLVFITAAANKNDTIKQLCWINLNSKDLDKPTIIWRGANASNFVIDDDGSRLAFIVTGSETYQNTIWHYTSNSEKAVALRDNNSQRIDSNVYIGSLSNFSVDGKRLFLMLKEKDYTTPPLDAVMVDVWHYADCKLQSQQLVEDVAGYGGNYVGPRSFMAFIDPGTPHIVLLENEYEKVNLLTDSLALITHRESDKSEESWNTLARPTYYLLSLTTGKRTQLNIPFLLAYPTGGYLVGEDANGNFYSYELASGKINDITKLIPVPKGDGGYDEPARIQHRGLCFFIKWLTEDSSLFLYDTYDIWQVDVKGKKAPINITNGYGRRNKTTFRFTENDKSNYSRSDKLILDAFDANNKNNGFYAVKIGRSQDPVPLVMKPSVFAGGDYSHYIGGEKPIKAANASAYMVKRSSATESPNYYCTKDFKSFRPLSNVFPEKKYNWIMSELRQFKTLDGRSEQGVLYKPENFDSTKKYPVIVNYYEKKSERLNQYITPDYSDGDINIPYFVSNGYLVFMPDIHYTIGKPGNSAYHSIVGAGEYLATLPWVNAKKMCIIGHSMGGFETNYVITHSTLFSAACSDGGPSNNVSFYNSFELNSGKSLQGFAEMEQLRMSSTLWASPNTYIENSPVFEADKVQTPVLMINNKLDAIVHFDQGVLFFMALRRLGKKAWMLQYDGEQHSVLQKRNKEDLTIRMTQFFDHYLKDAPSPSWMIKGIRARDKGIETGYVLDTTGASPGPGLLNPTP
jgi:dipeptidyl aminopeptidase/acylaminoacyl peptidase